MKHFTMLLSLAFAAVLLASCSDPAATTGSFTGKIALDSFVANPAYAWYQVGYDSYPAVQDTAAFNSTVATIKSSFDPTHQRILMVIKPSCSCQRTQTYMPRIMKALDMAGVAHDKIDLYITDARLVGFDDVKTQYNITAAPTFMVTWDGVDKGRIVEDPNPITRTAESLMAEFIAVR